MHETLVQSRWEGWCRRRKNKQVTEKLILLWMLLESSISWQRHSIKQGYRPLLPQMPSQIKGQRVVVLRVKQIFKISLYVRSQ